VVCPPKQPMASSGRGRPAKGGGQGQSGRSAGSGGSSREGLTLELSSLPSPPGQRRPCPAPWARGSQPLQEVLQLPRYAPGTAPLGVTGNSLIPLPLTLPLAGWVPLFCFHSLVLYALRAALPLAGSVPPVALLSTATSALCQLSDLGFPRLTFPASSSCALCMQGKFEAALKEAKGLVSEAEAKRTLSEKSDLFLARRTAAQTVPEQHGGSTTGWLTLRGARRSTSSGWQTARLRRSRFALCAGAGNGAGVQESGKARQGVNALRLMFERMAAENGKEDEAYSSLQLQPPLVQERSRHRPQGP